MIIKLTDNIFSVKRSDLNQRMTEVFDALSKTIRRDWSYLVVTSRKDGKINGSSELIKDIDIDFRSNYLIIVHKT